MTVTGQSTIEGLIIGGNRTPAANGSTFDVYDPSTSQTLATLAKAGRADVDAAVQAAQAALDSQAWGGMLPVERGRVLYRIAAALRDQQEELAILESRDTGKPLRQARADASVGARYFEFYAGVADKLLGSSIPLGPEYVDFTVKEPIGVSAQIVPWNYPLQIGSRGVAPALAAGCAIVMKPSSEAPMTALRLGAIALECGLPPGALNVIPGSGSECGAALASHPGINQLTFTGSVEVGVAVAKMAAENVVPCVMELGGKSPNIVFADADMDLAVKGVANAIFQNAGQTCSAGSRLLVERRAHTAFVEQLAQHAKAMRLGPGVEDPDMGPIISKRQLEIIEDYVKVGEGEGGTVVAGGKRPTHLKGGYFFEPTLIDRVTPSMRIAREEIFGPVLSIIEVDDFEQAVQVANMSEYGLIAGVWTRDINKAMRLATRIKCGQIYINTYGAAGGVELPFGGYKKSGYGREKGLEALATYLQIKNVCIKLGQ